jgi:homoserine dehydrogenase
MAMNAASPKSSRPEIEIVVIGLGNIGRRFLQILDHKRDFLRTRYGLAFKLVGAADSRGAAIAQAGLDLAAVVRLKREGRSVAEYPACGHPAMPPQRMLDQVQADVLCEASPVNLESGEPGLSCMRAAIHKGMHVVTANKGPLVLAYAELAALAREKGVRLRFCGTVAGGLPAINLGQRDLAGATIERIEAVPNLTTSFILERMTHGSTYERALAEAQAQGCAEADPSLDVQGWDAANKLVILANSVLGVPATLQDVNVQGIVALTPADLAEARAQGRMIKLVATAVRRNPAAACQDKGDDGEHGRLDSYTFTVAPTPLPADHPLAQLSGQQMGIVYYTDIYGTISAAILEKEPIPSAAALLRDMLSIYMDTPAAPETGL